MIKILLTLAILSPIICGGLLYFIFKKDEKVLNNIAIYMTIFETAIVILISMLYMKKGLEIKIDNVFKFGISFKFDVFRCIYATISAFVWLVTIIFSKEYMKNYSKNNRYYFFYLTTLSGVIGIFYSADLFTLYIFFEIMALSSYPLVIHEENERAMKAGELYLAISIISGMILLMGLLMLYNQVSSLNINLIGEYIINNGVSTDMFISGVLLLLGFGAKAGMFPLHIWLPKAHPIAPAPASAVLSGVLTKCGIFGLIIICSNIFVGNYNFAIILLLLSIITMFIGAALALVSVDIKRTLACSSISQIGFILLGISFMILLKENGTKAAEGTMLHMINHTISKLVLFIVAGVISMNTNSLYFNKIKGFGRNKPVLMIIFLIGSLSIMGSPLFLGYVSKTLIHEGILEYIKILNIESNEYILMKIVEWIFMISGGFTIAYMMKIFVCVFVEKNNDVNLQNEYDSKKNYMSLLSKIALILSAIVLIVLGVIPNTIILKIINLSVEFFRVKEMEQAVNFASFELLRGFLISLVIGIAIYFIIVRLQLIKDKEYIMQMEVESSIGSDIWHLVLIPILFIVKCIALIGDGLLVLLKKTILRPISYKFNDVSLAYKIGLIIDKVNPVKQDKKFYAKKVDKAQSKFMEFFNLFTSDFSFAMAMICIGLVIIIVFALLS